jgi:hypothetical protein
LTTGPNGQAVASAHLDAIAVINNKELFESLKEMNEALSQS